MKPTAMHAPATPANAMRWIQRSAETKLRIRDGSSSGETWGRGRDQRGDSEGRTASGREEDRRRGEATPLIHTEKETCRAEMSVGCAETALRGAAAAGAATAAHCQRT